MFSPCSHRVLTVCGVHLHECKPLSFELIQVWDHQALVDVLKTDPLYELSAREKGLVWNHHQHLATEFRFSALPKLLRSTKWTVPDQVCVWREEGTSVLCAACAVCCVCCVLRVLMLTQTPLSSSPFFLSLSGSGPRRPRPTAVMAQPRAL